MVQDCLNGSNAKLHSKILGGYAPPGPRLPETFGLRSWARQEGNSDEARRKNAFDEASLDKKSALFE